MKKFENRAVAGLVVATALLASSARGVWAHGDKKHKDQHVTVTADSQGYHPASINVKSGREVHLKFVSKGESCSNGISIPALHKTINLKRGQSKEVVFTPKKGQTINFACRMGMYKGKVVSK